MGVLSSNSAAAQSISLLPQASHISLSEWALHHRLGLNIAAQQQLGSPEIAEGLCFQTAAVGVASDGSEIVFIDLETHPWSNFY